MAKANSFEFSKSLTELEKIVQTMEQGDLSLEDALKKERFDAVFQKKTCFIEVIFIPTWTRYRSEFCPQGIHHVQNFLHGKELSRIYYSCGTLRTCRSNQVILLRQPRYTRRSPHWISIIFRKFWSHTSTPWSEPANVPGGVKNWKSGETATTEFHWY